MSELRKDTGVFAERITAIEKAGDVGASARVSDMSAAGVETLGSPTTSLLGWDVAARAEQAYR